VTPDLRRVLDALRSAKGASQEAPLAGRLATRAAAVVRVAGIRAGRRVVWPSAGRALLERFELPAAGRGEVTVEILASAISPGTERAQYLRLPNARPAFPHHPGYSAVGRVVDRGRGAGGLAVGELVAVPRAPHASLVTVPASEVYAVPDGVALAEASLTYLAIIAAYGVDRCGLEPGELVCVIGAGPIGLLAQRIAHARGAQTAVVAPSERARALVELTPGARLLHAVDELAAAAAIDAAGQEDTLELAASAAADGARVVLLGSPRGLQRLPLSAMGRRRLTVVGAHISRLAGERAETGRDDFRRFADEYLTGLREGTIAAADLVGEAVDPREPELAYRRLADGSLRSAYFDWQRLEPSERVAPAPVLPRRSSAPGSVVVSARPRATGERLGFAVIGCGDIGAENAAAIASAANARVVACYDAVPALAQAVAAQHGAVASGSLDAALAEAGVQAVVVSVPHAAHEEVSLAALERGLHLVVEKPVAHDLASARRIASAADRSSGLASVCFPFRFESAALAAQALIDEGALGELRGSTITMLVDKPPSYWLGGYSGRATSSWRTSRVASGGGILIMNATHLVDRALHLTGAAVEEVAAFASQSAETGEVEDSIAVSMRYAGGAVGSIVGASSARGGSSASGLTVWGTLGQIVLDDRPRAFTLHAAADGEAGRWRNLDAAESADPRVVYFERFVEAVRGAAPLDIALAAGVTVQEVVEAAYRSVESGRPVRIEELR